MPSPLPTTFASAAAGNVQDTSGGSKRDGTSGEWTRSRLNGATQTFRRPSLATSASHSRENASTTSASYTTPVAAYIPPHMNSTYQAAAPHRSGGTEGGDNRYSKEQLLDLYKIRRESGQLTKSVVDYFMADWNPSAESPTANGSWTKRDDYKESQTSANPEVCWDHTGNTQPLALEEMNDEERDLFLTSVNSPLKPPLQHASKDGGAVPGTGRKPSISYPQGHLSTYNTSSPGSVRSAARRRGTGESLGSTMSPTLNSRYFRDEPNSSNLPASLLRRKTDFVDATSLDSKTEEREYDRSSNDNPADLGSPFGSLKRNATNPVGSASVGSSSSPWPSLGHSSGFGGAFGSFSLGSASPQPGASTEKRTGYGSFRGESRFKDLLSRDKQTSEEENATTKQEPSVTGFELVPGDRNDPAKRVNNYEIRTRATRSETNPFDDDPRIRGASIGGHDVGTPTPGIDYFGLSAVGTTPSSSDFRDLMAHSQEQSHHVHSHPTANEPMSPTNTNPYQSPRGERVDTDDIVTNGSDIQLPGLSDMHDDSGPLSSIGRLQDISNVDRSQTSSAGAAHGFGGLGGLGGLGSLGSPSGWPTTGAIGTPSRDRTGFSSGFGDPIFGPTNDLQSPGFSTSIAGGGLFRPDPGLSLSSSTPRSSKLGSLFNLAMQEQMREEPGRQETGNDNAIRPPGESVSRSQGDSSPFDQGSASRDEHSSRATGGVFRSLSGLDIGSRFIRGDDPQRAGSPIQSSMVAETQMHAAAVLGQMQVSGLASAGDLLSQSGQPGNSSSTNQLSTAQQRTMVMPDRMRWLYKDPQGNTQGPWSGLEMHDWFKAGFFNADLQVKKVEDIEYEPLAQLIRRIGNSREPFLVPQIGVPHGLPAQSGSWGGGSAAPSSAQAGVIQPPLASSFPNFGTTLSADQQNALERRKQEEQYLMARQKEHLVQQQAIMRQMQFPAGSHTMQAPQLQHHSSAQSLHSQPSYGSITSPGGHQGSSIQGSLQASQGAPPFMDAQTRQGSLPNMGPHGPGSDLMVNQEDLPGLLNQLNMSNQTQMSLNTGAPFEGGQETTAHAQHVAGILEERARLQKEQEQYDKSRVDSIFDQRAREERLRQFHALRKVTDGGELPARRPDGLPTHPTSASDVTDDRQEQEYLSRQGIHPQVKPQQQPQLHQGQPQHNFSDATMPLSQQVKRATSVQWQQQQQQLESGILQPFPPPPSSSPLPAPMAQRNRQNVAEALAASSRSQSQTPVQTPTATVSVAPWAREPGDLPKGPSLKEIQEAEARKAAKLEEIAVAARRALAEQERANPQQPPAPGLPSTANWASSVSTGASTQMANLAWNKSPPGKVQAVPTATTPKKTLAQIQKEEEARKQRAAAAAAANTQANTNAPATIGGKRYADLAGKGTPPPTASSGGAWTTVGAGGKAKPSVGSLPPSTSTKSVAGLVSATPTTKTRPTATLRPNATSNTATSNSSRAIDELNKWAKMSLGKGLNNSINVDDFVQQLLLLPPETEIISDSVYANSQTLDGRRFAEEFVRRRKLADKGVVEQGLTGSGFGAASTEARGPSDGWNEVAKKGSSSTNTHRDDGDGAFKVVAAKKKGKR